MELTGRKIMTHSQYKIFRSYFHPCENRYSCRSLRLREGPFPPSMPKVVPEYKERARARIIDAALAVFRRKGLVASTMDDVAHEIGVSKGALYLYFPSKTQLLVGVLGQSRDQLISKLERTAGEGDIAEAVVRLVYSYFAEDFDPAVFHLLTAEAATDPEVREGLRLDQEEDIRHMSALLRRLEAAGRIPHQSDPEETAQAVMLLIGGAVALGNQRGDLTSLRGALVRALRRLVGLPEPGRSRSPQGRARAERSRGDASPRRTARKGTRFPRPGRARTRPRTSVGPARAPSSAGRDRGPSSDGSVFKERAGDPTR